MKQNCVYIQHTEKKLTKRNDDGVITALCPPPCPKCNSEFVYQDHELLICPECSHEWNPSEVQEDDTPTAKDANGTQMNAGDKITLIKDLKVKGSPMVLKSEPRV